MEIEAVITLFSDFTDMRTETDNFINDMESQMFINIIEGRVAEVNSESKVQVFPKHL